MNSSIEYAGKVTLKVKGKPPIKRKNTGTIDMFNLLLDIFSKATTTNSIKLDKRLPNFISIVESPDISFSSDTMQKLLIKSCPIVSRKSYKTESEFKVQYVSFLSNSNILSNNYEESSTLYFVLLDGDTDNPSILAYSALDEETINAIKGLKESSDIVQSTITWDLYFSNSQTVELGVN